MVRLKHDVVFVDKPAFSVLGVHDRVKPGDDALMDAWDEFLDLEESIDGKVEPGVYYGVVANYDPVTQEYDYLVGVQADGERDAPEGLVMWYIAAQTYAVFTTTVRGIGRMYQLIYNDWLPASDYRHAGGSDFEYYDASFDASLPDSLMFLYIPVQRA